MNSKMMRIPVIVDIHKDESAGIILIEVTNLLTHITRQKILPYKASTEDITMALNQLQDEIRGEINF